jgi:murein L,D-transpeptidase YafK
MVMGLLALVVALPLISFNRSPSLEHNKIKKIIVIKSQKRLFLIDGQDLVASYPVALGWEPGPKQRQEDLKTPEGRYENCWLKTESKFYKAIYVTYPNAAERRKGYTGGGIEIHGLERLKFGAERFLGPWIVWFGWTKGCVMVTNPDMDEIIGAVAFPVTVEILP